MNFDDEIPKHRSKKNTKKWCKGKEGRLHEFVWRLEEYRVSSKTMWTRLIFSCKVCGKVDDTYYSWDEKWYEKPIVGSTEPLKKKAK